MITYPEADGGSSIDRRIGQRVKSRRLEIGLSQEALAEALGVTFQQVQKYEKGVNRISASRLFEIAAVLNVPVGHFYDGLISARGPGVAEGANADADAIAETLATPEGVQLVTLFHAIRGPRLRRRIVDLVRVLSEDEGVEG
jgi:transcriptional regulator with XRE-family HTH domain